MIGLLQDWVRESACPAVLLHWLLDDELWVNYELHLSTMGYLGCNITQSIYGCGRSHRIQPPGQTNKNYTLNII
eukprot:542774-Heterocapsa_arctica.AAC.1